MSHLSVFNFVTQMSGFMWFVALPLTVLYWAVIDVEPPVTIKNQQVLSFEHVPNGRFIIEYYNQITRDCPVKSTAWMEDSTGRRFFFPSQEYSSINPGNVRRLNIVRNIPEEMASGTATYNVKVRYYCNPWQHFIPTDLTVTESFNILE